MRVCNGIDIAKVKVEIARCFLPKSLQFLLQQLICRDHEIQGHQTPNMDAFMIKKVVMLDGFDLDHEVRMPRLYCICCSFDCQVEMKIHGRTFHTPGSTTTSQVSVII